jgi:hypothetical protein
MVTSASGRLAQPPSSAGADIEEIEMRKRASALILTTLLLLATVQPAMAIVYGQKGDGGHSNVGALVTEIGGEITPVCSGTIIREGADAHQSGSFLTAAHCIVVLEKFGGFIPGEVYLSFGDQISASGLVLVTGGETHPWFNQRQSNPYDIGVLTFDDDTGLGASTVAGVGYLQKKNLRDKRFVTVGYGVVRGSKKKAHQAIDWSNVHRYYAEQSMQSLQKAWLKLAMNDRAVEGGGTCYGDSGGPHFLGETIVSITVTGDRFCKALDATYRLDRPWVHSFIGDYVGPHS